MDIKKELAEIKGDVDEQLCIYLDEVIEEVRSEDKFIATILVYFKETLLAGGKRIRPAMMQYGYLAAGGRMNKNIIKTSLSVELIHAFLLIHDDIIDRDDYRHGKKTIHAEYRDKAQKIFGKVDGEHFGVSTGIVLGDVISALGNNILFTSKFPSERIVQAMYMMQNVVGRTAVGEMQDVVMEFRGKATEKEILRMYENKTARYTFEGPLHLGAVLAGADENFCKKLSTFAIPLGIAFQLQDDLLGIFGSEKKTGKPVGSDIAEGKMTLLVARAYKGADTTQKKTLDRLLGKEDVTRDEIKVFQDILKETGAYQSVCDDIQNYIDEVHTHVMRLKLPRKAEDFFCGLATYLQNREY